MAVAFGSAETRRSHRLPLMISCLLLHAFFWHCAAITVPWADDSSTNSADQVMLTQEFTPDHGQQRLLTDHLHSKKAEVCVYAITIATGKRWGAGTDATISLRLYNNASQGVYFSSLDNAKNNFERGDVDKFQETGDCVDHVCKMILSTDNSGLFPGWFVETVQVFVTTTAAGEQEKIWQLHEWLPKDSSAPFFAIRDDC